MEEQTKNHQISNATAGAMLIIAGFYDLIQVIVNFMHIIPIIGTVFALFGGFLVTIFAWLTFFLWFRLNGVSFMNPKRFSIIGICGIVDAILSFLPAWVAAVALIIATTRSEEILEKAGPVGAVAGKAVNTQSRV